MTGASGGIGRAISLAFAKAGWFVGVHYHREKVAADATLRSVSATGGNGSVYQADLREARAAQEMVDAFCRDTSHPTAFVCNAGIGESSLIIRQCEEDWSNLIATNLTGTFHCFRAMAPALAARGGGSIVVIGSHAGFHGSVGQAAYAASKAGLLGLVRTAAQEWGRLNIRVNMVLPGWQQTRLSGNAMAARAGWHDHALRRPPSVAEVAQTVIYLARVQDVSGQIWNCDSRNL